MGRPTFPIINGATRDELVATLRHYEFQGVAAGMLAAYDAGTPRWDGSGAIGMQRRADGRWAIDIDRRSSYADVDALAREIHRVAPATVQVRDADAFLSDPAWQREH